MSSRGSRAQDRDPVTRWVTCCRRAPTARFRALKSDQRCRALRRHVRWRSQNRRPACRTNLPTSQRDEPGSISGNYLPCTIRVVVRHAVLSCHTYMPANTPATATARARARVRARSAPVQPGFDPDGHHKPLTALKFLLMLSAPRGDQITSTRSLQGLTTTQHVTMFGMRRVSICACAQFSVQSSPAPRPDSRTGGRIQRMTGWPAPASVFSVFDRLATLNASPARR